MAAPKGITYIVGPCENCGTEVRRRKGSERARMFCSQTCYWTSDYRRELAVRVNAARFPQGRRMVHCSGCGVEFGRPPSKVVARNYCSRACRVAHQRDVTLRQVTSGGYIRVFVGRDQPGADKSGHMFEHRKVMQDLLGRPLLPIENVHHKNGVRDDNRPENLELWTRSQPRGQRVVDKIAWAREFLALYEGTTLKE